VDPAAINALLRRCSTRLQNEIEPLRQARSNQLEQLIVAGLLHHLAPARCPLVPESSSRSGQGASEYLPLRGTNTTLQPHPLHAPLPGFRPRAPPSPTGYRGRRLRADCRARWGPPPPGPSTGSAAPMQPSRASTSEQQKELLLAVVGGPAGRRGLLQETRGGAERIGLIFHRPS